MAQSVVDCCNSALQKVGSRGILSLTEDGREARACRKAFDSNRRAELRTHAWKFSIKRVVLAPDSAAPAFDYLYQFTLPADCVRVLFPQDPTLDWVVEGRAILTSMGGGVLNLRYISDVEDATLWDPAFYDMVAISLALDLVETLTTSTGKKQLLEKDYEDALNAAKKVNAFETLPAAPSDSSFVTVRY